MKFDTPLCKLAYKYGTDKCPQIAHSYTPFYHLLFGDKRKSIRKLLEIGVAYEGSMSWPDSVHAASLHMWRDYFPNANIYGIDIIEKCVFKKDRIQTFLCDQANPIELRKLIEITGSDIDIIIDDGSHNPRDIIISCLTLMPLVNKDVTYVIEDTNRYHAATVLEFLENYDCKVMRRSKMRTPDDRLIVVSNK